MKQFSKRKEDKANLCESNVTSLQSNWNVHKENQMADDGKQKGECWKKRINILQNYLVYTW